MVHFDFAWNASFNLILGNVEHENIIVYFFSLAPQDEDDKNIGSLILENRRWKFIVLRGFINISANCNLERTWWVEMKSLVIWSEWYSSWFLSVSCIHEILGWSWYAEQPYYHSEEGWEGRDRLACPEEGTKSIVVHKW